MPYKASMEIDSMIYNLPVNNGNITFITSAVVIATYSGCCIQHTAVNPEVYQLPLDSTCHCYHTLTSGCQSTHLGAGLCPEQNSWASGTAGAFGQTSRTFFRHETINREKLLIQILYFKSSKCSTLKLKIQLWLKLWFISANCINHQLLTWCCIPNPGRTNWRLGLP